MTWDVSAAQTRLALGILMPGFPGEWHAAHTNATQMEAAGPPRVCRQVARTCCVAEAMQQDQQVLVDPVRRALEQGLCRQQRSGNGAFRGRSTCTVTEVRMLTSSERC